MKKIIQLCCSTSIVNDEIFVLTRGVHVSVAEDPAEYFSELVSLSVHRQLTEVGKDARLYLVQRQQRRRELQHNIDRLLIHPVL